MSAIQDFIDSLEARMASSDAVKHNHVSVGMLVPSAHDLLAELRALLSDAKTSD